MSLIVAGFALLELIEEAAFLVDWVVELREAIGQLAAVDEELEAVGDARVFRIALRERRDLRRMARDERRLHQCLLDLLLEGLVEDAADAVARLVRDADLVSHLAGLFDGLAREEILARRLFDGIVHADALDLREIDLDALVIDDRRAENALGGIDDNAFRDVHHVRVVSVRLVELDRRELRVVADIHALVAEDAAHLVDAVETADDEALEVELRRDAQVEVDVECIVVRDERARCCAAGDRREYRRLDLEVIAIIEVRADGLDDLRALAEGVADLRVHDEVEVALAVTDVDVLQAVELLRQRAQRLREQVEVLDADRHLAAVRLEDDAADADDVADIELLELVLVLVLAEHIDLEVDLDVARAVVERAERRLAMAADGHETAGDADLAALFIAFKMCVFLLDWLCIIRDFVTMAKRRHAHRAEFFHLFAADLHHLIEVFHRSLLPLLLLICHTFHYSNLNDPLRSQPLIARISYLMMPAGACTSMTLPLFCPRSA